MNINRFILQQCNCPRGRRGQKGARGRQGPAGLTGPPGLAVSRAAILPQGTQKFDKVHTKIYFIKFIPLTTSLLLLIA